MTAAQFELIDETEAEAILRWRFEELVRAGYDIGSALVLASHVEIDLNHASALTRRGPLKVKVTARLSSGNTKTMAFRGHVLARLGRTAEARDILRTLESLSRERYVPPYMIAIVHLGLGERDAALASLDRAYEARDIHLVFLPVDPRWDACRSDPRFRALIEEGQQAGVFRTDKSAELVVDFFFGAVHHLGTWFRKDGELTGEQIGEQFADLLLTSLRPGT